MRRRYLAAAAAATLSVLGVLTTLPGVAEAAQPLVDDQPVTAASPTSYTAATKPATSRWSVVGLRSPWSVNHDLTVNGTPSTMYGPLADFVAVNNGCPGAPTALTAKVTRAAGSPSGEHTVELAQSGKALTVDPLPFPDTNVHIASIFGPGISTKQHFVGVRTVRLVANRQVEVYAAHMGGAPGEVFVLAPGASANCLHSRQQIVGIAAVNFGGGAAHLRFTPTVTADFAVVQVSYGPDPQAGYSSLRVGQARAA